MQVPVDQELVDEDVLRAEVLFQLVHQLVGLQSTRCARLRKE